jgi:hypothetical protein
MLLRNWISSAFASSSMPGQSAVVCAGEHFFVRAHSESAATDTSVRSMQKAAIFTECSGFSSSLPLVDPI